MGTNECESNILAAGLLGVDLVEQIVKFCESFQGLVVIRAYTEKESNVGVHYFAPATGDLAERITNERLLLGPDGFAAMVKQPYSGFHGFLMARLMLIIHDENWDT